MQVEKHLQRREIINRMNMNFIIGKYNLPNYYVTKLLRTFQRFSFAPTGGYTHVSTKSIQNVKSPFDDL